MIVQCPSCSKRYRVNDANIPASGGKIRCPECAHSFVVYPESDPEPQQSDPSSHQDPGAKTSVAERPNMEELLNNMQGGGGAGDDAGGGAGAGASAGGQSMPEEDEVAKTEVMSGSELPDFNNLFGEGGPGDEGGDATVEMSNPLDNQSPGGGPQHGPGGGPQQGPGGGPQQGPGGGPEQGAGGGPQRGAGVPGAGPDPAEDDLKTQQLDSDVVHQSLGQVRDQAESSPPVEQPPEPGSTPGQTSPPAGTDNPPGRGQQRASVPDDPTPPPGSGPSPGGGSGASGFGAKPGGSNPASGGAGGGGGFGAQPAGESSSPGGASPGGGGFGAQPAGESSSPGGASPGGGGFGAQPAGGDAGPAGGGADPGGQPAGDGPDPDHEGPWKLKTNYGLTYEFADNQSLRDWLDGRDELDGYELSADEGDTFYPLEDFPQVGTAAGANKSGANRQISSSGAQPPSPGRSPSASGPLGAGDSATGSGGNTSPSSPGRSGSAAGRTPSSSGPLPSSPGNVGGGGGHSPFHTASGSVPAVDSPGDSDADSQQAKEKIDPNEKFEPPSRDNAALNYILWGLFGVLAVAAIALALQLFGVVDVAEMVGLDGDDEVVTDQHDDAQQAEQPAQQEDAPQQDQPDEQPDEQVDDQAAEEVDGLLEEAGELYDDEEFGPALDALQEAQDIDPERAEIYELQADAHEELGEPDEADEARETADHLREHGELPD